jgi:hypothetical protein
MGSLGRRASRGPRAPNRAARSIQPPHSRSVRSTTASCLNMRRRPSGTRRASTGTSASGVSTAKAARVATHAGRRDFVSESHHRWTWPSERRARPRSSTLASLERCHAPREQPSRRSASSEGEGQRPPEYALSRVPTAKYAPRTRNRDRSRRPTSPQNGSDATEAPAPVVREGS